ncbi:phosphodiester glycosidase family protein [Clostridium sp. MB40-C1]|uniref:phosphodiester glycosidase family protein n=1 Tax=Clostridium sp. MB40-C1 TaxID=3070996 RepID=UPI0027DFF149|nr:phosphodiester glycosidase family protein [Clostridium sp. MB40-C1]WMJ79869.1 phosphodiester glycosidase family protein [Clostridium sp. MB40-C1]
MFKNKSEKDKKPKKWFIIFEIIFTIISAPFLLYYGPFDNIKTTVVGSAMTTSTHQWIATMFLSKEHINQILSRNKIENIVQTDIGKLNEKITNKINNNPKASNEIERYYINGDKFTGHLLVIKNPKRVKVGFSDKLGKSGETTSEIAKRYNAVAAINAGGFDANSIAPENTDSKTSGSASGIIISNGKEVYNSLKKDEKSCIAGITQYGALVVGNHTVEELKKLNVTNAVSFGPCLIVNGEKTITSGDGGWGTAPRTAIGQRKDGSILFLVIDGKYIGRLAVTLRELQDILYEYGAYYAINLDGGSSSTMYYKGKVISNPYKSTGEREIPSIFYVTP